MKNKLVAVMACLGTLLLAPLVIASSDDKAEKKEPARVEKHEAAPASADQAAMKKEARITMETARRTALHSARGKVESEELEREHGKLIYSFDIRNAKGTIDEVNVDAITGKVVKVEHESKAKEAAEKKQEAKEKARH